MSVSDGASVLWQIFDNNKMLHYRFPLSTYTYLFTKYFRISSSTTCTYTCPRSRSSALLSFSDYLQLWVSSAISTIAPEQSTENADTHIQTLEADLIKERQAILKATNNGEDLEQQRATAEAEVATQKDKNLKLTQELALANKHIEGLIAKLAVGDKELGDYT
ncbi:hypothetical protein G6011_04567 [Alternaria panax]|uniref:Uncharacterized protein n=1 Tax=Alternaria panax TaxID=48097 RepID=A0AAD4IGS1_9PLEO|nr:hypothetical protein G6011_04567 [Alternaria panax]